MNADLIWIGVSLITWGLGESMFYEFRPLYLQQLGADPLVIGSILGAVGAAMAVSHLPAGYLSDRFGRRPLILIAWVIGVAASWLMAAATDLTIFSLGIILYGFTYFVNGPLYSYVTAARGSLGVGRVLTLISACFSFGGIFGPLIGGWLGQQFGLRPVLFVASGLFVLSTIFIFQIRPQPVVSISAQERSERRGPLITRRFVQFLIVVFAVMFVLYLPQPLAPNFLQNQRGVSLIDIGKMVALSGLGVVVLDLILGHINSRIGFILTQVSLGFFITLLWLGTGKGWYMVGYFFMGGFRTASMLATAQGKALLHDSRLGLGYGLIAAAVGGSMVLAPPLAGWLYTRQPEMIFSVSLPLLGAAILLTLFGFPLSAADVD